MKTPNELAQDLIKLANQLHTASALAGDLDLESRKARSRFEVAYARAFLTSEGPMDVRKQQAVLDTADVKLDAEIADAKLKACQENLRYIRSSLDVGRTLSATVRSEWAATEAMSA